ncbi:zinc ribbon domain-containing protein [Natronomonas marina]|jgi:predicted RNA-binding Zn-ribbon protein involved in translation (DUF1610 family)|uniref:zinc ribbon domain-containing protein n=1 Tax=Natronomonas marina TaxID=2961939 RepID=UPI0020C97C13|nr:zinc ribbon domain-containing protein [Natronomonas marina]
MESRPSADDVPPKSTLFCPNCGHRSRPDGDWQVVETGHRTRYLCPDCRAEVAVRPAARTDRQPAVGSSIAENIRLWAEFWVRTARRW